MKQDLLQSLGAEAASALDNPPVGCDIEADLARWWAGEHELDLVGLELFGERRAPWQDLEGEIEHLQRVAPEVADRVKTASNRPENLTASTREILDRQIGATHADKVNRWVPMGVTCPKECLHSTIGCICWRSINARK